MNHASTTRAAWLPLGLLVSAAAVGQTPPAGPTQGAPQDVIAPATFYDPAQLPSFSGKVQQFTLSAHGEIDGLILTDGTEVKTPPHLSTSIAYAIRPGDTVTIRGLHAAAVPLLQATTITDHTSARTIIDTEPGPGPAGPRRITEVQGSIRMTLHGARGEINGALLMDGTVLRLPPDVEPWIPSCYPAKTSSPKARRWPIRLAGCWRFEPSVPRGRRCCPSTTLRLPELSSGTGPCRRTTVRLHHRHLEPASTFRGFNYNSVWRKQHALDRP